MKRPEFGEPWRIEGGEIVHEDGNPAWLCGPDDNERTVACVNFCQHLPTEMLEALLAQRVGAATFIQWARQWSTGEIATEDYAEACQWCANDGPLHSRDCPWAKARELVRLQ